MKQQILVLLAATVIITTFCATDERVAHAEHKRCTVYERYSCLASGINGIAVATVATPFTGGLYAVKAVAKFGDLLVKRLALAKSLATEFDGKSRKKLEQETRLAELINHGSQAAVED